MPQMKPIVGRVFATNPTRSLAAFDQLPQAIRQTLAYCVNPLSTEETLAFFTRTKSIQRTIDLILKSDLKKTVATSLKLWGTAQTPLYPKGFQPKAELSLQDLGL